MFHFYIFDPGCLVVIDIRQSEFGAQNRSGVHRNLQFFARANIKCAGAVATNEDNSSEQVFGGKRTTTIAHTAASIRI